MAKKEMDKFHKRCENCACLIENKGKWCCDECFGCPIEEVDDCPEGITLEEVTQIEEKTADYKVNVGAKAEITEKKDRKPRTVHISDEKSALFSTLYDLLSEKYGENVQILNENKLISVKIGDKDFKIDVIEVRKKKNE